MSKEFSILFEKLHHSRCAKKQIGAGTYVNSVFHYAVNDCEHEGAICPRLNLPSGQGYELCNSIHAESALAAFLQTNGWKSDGIAWVAGHYWACEPCANALKEVGVLEIRVRESSHVKR